MRKALGLIGLRFRRTWWQMLVIALATTVIGWLWYAYSPDAQDDEVKAYDDGVKKFTGKPWFPWGAVHPSDDLVVVAIDDKTFKDIRLDEAWRQRYGSWPYDRVLYADVFEFLHSVGAKLVVFDVILDEAKTDNGGDLALGRTVVEQGLPLYLGFNVNVWGLELPKVVAVNRPPLQPTPPRPPTEDAGGDDEALDTSDFPFEEDAGAPSPEETPAFRQHVAELYAFPVEVRGGLVLPTLPTDTVELFDGGVSTVVQWPRLPVPAMQEVLDSVSGYGLVLEEGDDDGKLRRTHFVYTDGQNSYVTLPLAAAADVLGADKVIIEPHQLTIGSKRIRIDADGAAWINYRGRLTDRFPSVSLVDVLRYVRRPALRAKAEARFKDKYVFVGGFALGTGDSKATPLEARTPGVVKQLATFDNLLHDDFITDAPKAVSFFFTLVVAFLSAALVLIIRNTFFDIAWPVILWLGFFMVTGSFLVLTDVHVLSALPSFAGSIASVIATTWERLFASRERDRMKDLFKPYLEEDLVDLLVEQKELPKLDGEVRRITVFFSDIRGFSTFSEVFHSDPQGLMKLLNRYLSTVTPALRSEGACIDKYIGDAVVALFGAPVRHDDHALRACRAALAVQQVIAGLREALRAEGLPDVYTRIGLNTDDLLIGNIGSDQLLDYTAIGDGMNLASRLEGVNKVYGTLILMGENTFLEVKDQVVAREVDVVRVAGKHVATRLYELVGLKGQVAEQKLEVLRHYALALDQYRSRKFAEAKTLALAALGLDPGDGPSQTLLARCERFLEQLPPPEWDGVADLEK